MLRILTSSLLCLSLVAGCASPPTSPAPSTLPPGASPSSTFGPPADASLTPSQSAGTPGPTDDSIASPAVPSSPASVALPMHGSAREIALKVRLAPGPDGLYVSIPRPGGSVLVLLDSSGRPGPGWPVVVKDSTDCGLLVAAADGSVRAVCTLENPDGNMFAPVGAYAYDSNGRLRGRWPVDAHFDVTGRMVGNDLVLLAPRSLGDVIEPGKPSVDVGLIMIAGDGTVRTGARVPILGSYDRWGVAPDGVAYGVTGDDASKIWAVNLSGLRPGWPVNFEGFASGPVFQGGVGRIAVVVGSPTSGTSQVLGFDRNGIAVRDRSAVIPIVTVTEHWAAAGGCAAQRPQSPLVAPDGTIVVFSEEDRAIFAVDWTLKLLPGWPYRPATPLVLRDERYVKEDAYCPFIALPAAGIMGTLYLPLQAPDRTVGGSLAAIDLDGHLRARWPVGLRRPGSEFWSVAAGFAGGAIALAVEPESSTSSSATILTMSEDGTVFGTTTIINP